MLTPEQILNLKPGDKLVHEVYFETKKGDYIYCSFSPFPSFDRKSFTISPSCLSLPSEYGTSVPTPKHDPCRPFRAGDIVAPRVVNGRTDIDLLGCFRFTVMQDESPRHYVPVKSWLTKNITTTHAVYLELVTPVEELEQYRVVDAHTHFDVDDKYMKTVVSYSKVHHPSAKAAAEAERDRLNAEWRKEQNNDHHI